MVGKDTQAIRIPVDVRRFSVSCVEHTKHHCNRRLLAGVLQFDIANFQYLIPDEFVFLINYVNENYKTSHLYITIVLI